MKYTKDEIVNDGGQRGGDAILTNMQNGIAAVNAGTTSLRGGYTSRITGVALDFSAATVGANVGLGQFDAYIGGLYTSGADDSKVFDHRNCSITQLHYFTTATFNPINLNTFIGTRDTHDYLTFEYTGRLKDNIQNITPVDNTTSIDLAIPGHGLPLNTELLTGIISTGSYKETGDLTARLNVDFAPITDPDVVTLNITLAAWDTQMARSSVQNLYIDSAIYMGGGGNNYSVNTLDVTWFWDANSETYDDSVYSDN